MKPNEVVLGVDLGTSGVKVVALNVAGQVVAEASATYPLYTPQPGWTEQKPLEWWEGSQKAILEVTQALPAGAVVLALGLSGQMHGMVALDVQGDVIRPALLWNDQRTGDAVKTLEATIPRATLIQRTGNPPISGFQLPKVIWLRQNEPENYAKVAHILLPKDYLAYKLTGQMRAEPSDASGTGCFNLEAKDWDAEILAALDIPLAWFPQVIASDAVVGTLHDALAQSLGLPKDLPVVAGAGDNAAAATGLGISKQNPKLGSLSVGSSGVIFAPLDRAQPDPQGRVHLFCHADGQYNLLGVTLAAASSLQWLRNTLFPNHSYDELTALAAQSEPGSRGVTFKPYLAGERTPHLDPNLRASFSGLSLANTAADMVRAVLEGVAFSLRDALEIIKPLSSLEACVVTGGGTESELWLQIIADVLNMPMHKPASEQGAAFGAAVLALRHILGSYAQEPQIVSTVLPQNAAAYEAAWERYKSL
jgi:xylulokinase